MTTTSTTKTTTTWTTMRRKNEATTPPPTTSSKTNIAILETILGVDLWKKKDGKLAKVSLAETVAKKEFVALYFGAQWSSYSTAFTPQLVDFCQQAHTKNKNALEAIYVSSDATQEEFDQHFGQMTNFSAVVSDSAERLKQKNDLIPLFKAFRVPCMCILHVPTGQFVTEHGVKDVRKCLSTDSLTVHDTLNQWRDTTTKSIQDAHKLIDYGGGTMSVMMFFYQNPYLLCAFIAIAMYTSILRSIYEKPMILLGFLFLFKRYLTPKGDQNMPGKLLSGFSAKEEEVKKSK
mmetsp:Transcript_132285/g.382449  ORF Transcript_132285/g.382449 Transcript_132285/m.382449 type:complete len:290 (-) Transcript_132285:61-930(-)